MAEATRRYAVVTGSNKGIGFAISKQLASNGITVVVTARDVKRGLEAVDKLKQLGLSDQLVFHQLDVTYPDSIASLASFIKTQFGKLDILVNNAAIVGANVDTDALEAAIAAGEIGANVEWTKFTTPTYESVAAGIRTNYYGAKGMCEAFIPLLKLADSPRIVNVSSIRGSLEVLDPKHRLVFCQTFWLSSILLLMLMQRLPNSWAKGVLSDVESLTEEKLDGVLNQFLEDFKESLLETKGWPTVSPAYRVSKVALNAYTRILAKKWHHFDQMSSVSANLHEN